MSGAPAYYKETKMETNQTQSAETQKFIEMAEHYGANDYHPLPIVISQAKGVWVKSPEGKKYMDMLSAYSALNHGHRHPRVLKTLVEQAKKVTLTSRAFNNDQVGPFFKELCEFTGYEMVLPMNTGAEAVETALKAARKWGYKVKGVAEGKAEIIVCSNNFHGRTISIVSFSTEAQYRDGFGPFTPGFKIVAYGNLEELKAAFNPGDHGSTFGGNPLACAVSRMALKVLTEEKLVEQSFELGAYFMEKLRG